jgi:hypothetical protein
MQKSQLISSKAEDNPVDKPCNQGPQTVKAVVRHGKSGRRYDANKDPSRNQQNFCDKTCPSGEFKNLSAK